MAEQTPEMGTILSRLDRVERKNRIIRRKCRRDISSIEFLFDPQVFHCVSDGANELVRDELEKAVRAAKADPQTRRAAHEQFSQMWRVLEENHKLKRLVAELSLEKQILKDVAERNF